MKFLKRIRTWFIIIISSIKGFLNKNIDPALDLVNIIKEVVDSPTLDIITRLTETKWDNVLLDRLRLALSKAVTVLEISSTCNKKETDEEKLRCFILSLRGKSPAMQSAVYKKLATLVAIEIADEKLQEHEADALVQISYSNRKLTA